MRRDNAEGGGKDIGNVGRVEGEVRHYIGWSERRSETRGHVDVDARQQYRMWLQRLSETRGVQRGEA